MTDVFFFLSLIVKTLSQNRVERFSSLVFQLLCGILHVFSSDVVWGISRYWKYSILYVKDLLQRGVFMMKYNFVKKKSKNTYDEILNLDVIRFFSPFSVF